MAPRENPIRKRTPIVSVDSTVVGAPNLIPEPKKPAKPKPKPKPRY